MSHRVARAVALLIALVVVMIAAAFALGLVTYQPAYRGEPKGTTIKPPESGPKAIPGGP
jgi:hypothetical protein